MAPFAAPPGIEFRSSRLSTPTEFLGDVVRLVIWLVLLTIVFVPLERLFALRPSTLRRAEIGNDLAYYFLNSLVPAAIIAVPLALLTAVLQRIVPAGYTEFIHGLPVWASIPLGLVVADIGSYWGHRLSHEIPFLWRFHAVHHSAEHIDFMVNTRAHPIDMVVTRLAGLVPVYLLGLGATDAGGSMLPVYITLIGTVAGFFVHANVRWRFGPLEWLVATPAFHHWHHTRRDHIDRNYAATLPVIDRLFGTYYLPREWPAEYGTDTVVGTTLGRQLLTPFGPATAAGTAASAPPPSAGH